LKIQVCFPPTRQLGLLRRKQFADMIFLVETLTVPAWSMGRLWSKHSDQVFMSAMPGRGLGSDNHHNAAARPDDAIEALWDGDTDG
jgi:hypothetical protein